MGVKLNVNDLNSDAVDPYDGTVAYAYAKRAQVTLSELWASRIANNEALADTVVVNSMHPGWADTPGVRTQMADFAEKRNGSLRNPKQGADPIVWLAAAE